MLPEISISRISDSLEGVLKALGGGGGMHSILANTAIERISTFQADHDYSQVSLGDAGIEFAEELFVPVFEKNRVLFLLVHEVPAFPVIRPRPELRVIHIFSTPCTTCN
jgi:hypothetical protein